MRLVAQYLRGDVLLGDVGLIDRDDLRHISRIDLRQHLPDRRDLLPRYFVGPIDDVDDDVGVANFLEGRTERFHELVREMTHEADGVRHRDVTTSGRPNFANRRIEGGEQ